MPKPKKAVETKNYTSENEATLKAGYDPEATQDERDDQVQKLAESMGKTVPSIRMKLTSMKIYVKKGKVSKTGGKVESKADLIGDLVKNTGKDEHFFRSLENVTKDVLQFFVAETRPKTTADLDTLRGLVDELEILELDEIEAAQEENAIDTMHS